MPKDTVASRASALQQARKALHDACNGGDSKKYDAALAAANASQKAYKEGLATKAENLKKQESLA
jgi:uncharacterized protein YukE